MHEELLKQRLISRMDKAAKLQVKKQAALDERNAARAHILKEKIEEICRSAVESEKQSLDEKKKKNTNERYTICESFRIPR